MSLFQANPSHHCQLICMKPEQLEEIAAMKSIKFIIGHSREEFYIHQGLVSRLSASLDALVNGDDCVTLEDVDDDVFARFAQFVYRGAYAGFSPTAKAKPDRRSEGAPKPMTDEIENLLGKISLENPLLFPTSTTSQGNINRKFDSVASTEPFQRNDKDDAFKLPYSLVSYKMAAKSWNDNPFGGCVHAGLSKPGPSEHKFDIISCDCGPSSTKLDYISAFMAKSSGLVGPYNWQIWPTLQTQSFERVFIGHARIWIFADRFAIASLMDLACAHLVYELAQWTVSASTFVSDFGGLVRYVYGDRTARGCPLRLLVAQFAACVAKDVSRLEGWRVLLDEVPAFTGDLLHQITKQG